MNDLGLRDRISIVTGGGKGIGYQTAKTLGENGVSTVIADIDFSAAKEAEREIKATGAKAISVKTDVCNLDSVRSMVQTTISTYNKVDILVNNVILFAVSKLADYLNGAVLDVNGGYWLG